MNPNPNNSDIMLHEIILTCGGILLFVVAILMYIQSNR